MSLSDQRKQNTHASYDYVSDSDLWHFCWPVLVISPTDSECAFCSVCRSEASVTDTRVIHGDDSRTTLCGVLQRSGKKGERLDERLEKTRKWDSVKSGTFRLYQKQTRGKGNQERLQHLFKHRIGTARQVLEPFGPKMVKPHPDHHSWQEPSRLSCDYSAEKKKKAGAQRKVGGWTTKLKGVESRSYREESKGILMVNHTHKCRSFLTSDK